MANQITVSTEQLNNKATELKNYNDKLKKEISNLQSIEQQLHGMWEGDAHSEFHKQFNSDIIQMTNFYNAIEKYISVLIDIHNRYVSAENRSRSIAQERKYK